MQNNYEDICSYYFSANNEYDNITENYDIIEKFDMPIGSNFCFDSIYCMDGYNTVKRNTCDKYNETNQKEECLMGLKESLKEEWCNKKKLSSHEANPLEGIRLEKARHVCYNAFYELKEEKECEEKYKGQDENIRICKIGFGFSEINKK